MSVVDTIMTGGAPSFKFEKVGDEITGEIVEVGERQDQVFGDETGTQLKWWNRGPGPATGSREDRPVMIPIFTLQTDLRDSEEDDGLRSIWARGNCFSAIRTALVLAYKGRKKPQDDDLIGGTLKIRHHKKGEAKKGFQPAKLFVAKFEPRSIVDSPIGGHGDSEDPGAGAERW